MEIEKIHEYTDAYLEAYMRSLDKTHNPDLAVQVAAGVIMVLRMVDAQNEPKQPQMNPMAALFGAMMQQAVQNQQDPEHQESDPKGSEIESDDDE